MIMDTHEKTKPISLSELDEIIDTSVYDTDEYGEKIRPHTQITATLSNETEDYIRILRVIGKIEESYIQTTQRVYNNEDGIRRSVVVGRLTKQLREEIATDLGHTIADRLQEWKEEYL